MVRVFRSTERSGDGESLWSFSYVDWQGKPRVGVGTESRQETKSLADRVQEEHDLLRAHRRTSLGGSAAANPHPVLEALPGTAAELTERPTERSGIHFVGEDVILGQPRRTPPSDQSGLLGEQLVGAGLISNEDLVGALTYQEQHGGRLAEVLFAQEALSPDEFVLFLGKVPGTPRIELANCVQIPAGVLQLIPGSMAQELEVIPVDRIGKMLSVAMVCPLDRAAVDRLQRHTGLKIRPMLCSHGEFRTALLRHYGRSLGEAERRTAS